jgi:phage shock protein C
VSTPYPPPPKKLMRRPANKMIGGVCSGLADYLNMDVTLVRILTVVISLFTGVPIILYIVALFVIPEEGAAPPPQVYPPAPPASGYTPTGYTTSGYTSPESYSWPAQPPTPAPSPGPAPQSSSDPVWGNAGAPWEQPSTPGPTDPVSDPERKPEA